MGATDSKLTFRKSVFRLFEEKSIPLSADDYWSLFWTLPESADDVYSLIGASDIRRARDSSRENLETLIDKIIQHMAQLVETANFASTPSSTTELLNCCRVLSRVIPYIFEQADSAEWEDKIFWVPRSVERTPPPEGDSSTDQKSHYDTLSPRGDVLMSLTLQCLFLTGFSLPATMTTPEGGRINYVIWESGVGSSTPIGSSREHDLNRIEVLRLLTVLLSKSMYVSPAHVLSKQDQWLHYIVSKTERKVVLALLCSLLNTACKYNPLGWGVPYNHVVFSDAREQLVVMCLRVLLVILDYHSPQVAQSIRQADEEETSSPEVDVVAGMDLLAIKDPERRQHSDNQVQEMDPQGIDINNPKHNAFRHYLSKLHRAQDFQFLIDGIYRILSNPMQANNTYLPYSTKRVRCNVEMLMLCWKLLETNSRFRNYLVDTERALDVMVVLIYYAMENKTNPAQVGLVRMCAFILQTLSSDRTFGVKLNRSFDGHSSLPASIRIPAFHGSYADFLIISIFNLIASSRGTLSTLYPALILTLTNISPYLKNLSVTSSSKLMSLFGSMSAPGFLLADESNHRLVGYLCEAFTNIVQYQFSVNPNLIYAIVRSRSKFEKLRDFKLADAVAEVERVRQLKEEKLRRSQQPQLPTVEQAAETSNKEPDTAASANTESPQSDGLSEKVRGKLPKNDQMAMSRQSSDSNLNGQSSVASSSASLLPGAKHGFYPTQEWAETWHAALPLASILIMLDNLVPQIENMCTTQALTSDAHIVDFLRGVTMVGILPAPPPILIRKFKWGEALVIWFRSMLWGQAYVSSIADFCPWNGTSVRLFQIMHQTTAQQQQPSQQSSLSPRPSTSAA